MVFHLLGWELKVGTMRRRRVEKIEGGKQEEDGENRSPLDVLDREHVH